MIESQLAVLEPCVRTVTTILMHSLWQGILVGILAAVTLSLLRRSNVRTRYVVSCAAMAATIVAAAVTVVLVWPDGHGQTTGASTVTNELVSGDGSSDVSATINIPAPINDVPSSNRWWNHPSISRYFFMIWVAGVMLLSVYHLLGWRRARGFARRGTSPVPSEWQTRFEKLCDELRVRRLLSLLSSSLVKVPCVVGWVKPVILVPVSTFTSLSPSDIEMILVHEIAHVRRYDVLVNMIQAAMETLFFFNPAIWWLSRQIRIEREDCCDETAILRTGDRLRYARALANLEELRMFKTSVGTAITGTPLRRRIERIVGATRPRLYSSALSLSGLLLIISIIAVLVGSSGGLKSSAVQAGEKIESTQTLSPGPGDLRGEWEVDSGPDEIRILVYGKRSSGMSFRLASDEVAHLIDQRIQPFKIVRDAGTLYLEGTIEEHGRNIEGHGDWWFRPDSGYVRSMLQYGLREDDSRQVLSLAIHDVSLEFVTRMEQYGYRNLDVTQLLSARVQGITPKYVEELRRAGYADVPYDRLLSMRVHGVTANDAREFEKLGVGHLTADELISARVQGVTPEYVEKLQRAGYDDVPYDRLLSMRVQGVTADDGREFEKLGVGHVTPDQLISARVQGVTPAFVRSFHDAGFRDLSFNSFIALRAFDLDVGDFKDCYRHRFMDMSEDNMVWVCGFGITREDIERMKRHGYTDIDSIIKTLAQEYGR